MSYIRGMSILHSDVDISLSYYVLLVSISSGMSSGSMNGGVCNYDNLKMAALGRNM